MKKKSLIIVLIFLLFGIQAYAQTPLPSNPVCAPALPYAPTFGTTTDIHTAEVDQWVWQTLGWNPPPSASHTWDTLWRFRSVNGALVPSYLFTPAGLSNVPATRSFFSRCLALDQTKQYALSFNAFVGETSQVAYDLSVHLVISKDTIHTADIYGPQHLDTVLIGRVTNMPHGRNTVGPFLVDHIKATGNYRIMFTLVPRTPSITSLPTSLHLTDIVFDEIDPQRVKVVGLASPISKCNLDGQRVSFYVQGAGYSTVGEQTFSVCYQHNAGPETPYGTPICETFTKTFTYGEIQELSFTAPGAFNSPVVMFNAWASYVGQTVFDTIKDVVVFETAAQSVPYSCSFEDREWWRIIPNSLYPDSTWTRLFDTETMTGRASIATYATPSDDRLVSGCITLEGGLLYKISFAYRAHSLSHENLLLYVGTSNTPSDDDITLMNIKGFNNRDPRTVHTYFQPQASGSYFFGFLAHSDLFSSGITISSFEITAATAAPVPAFMGFEDYEDSEGWQMFDYDATTGFIQTGGSPLLNTYGWERGGSGDAINPAAFGSTYGMRVRSKPSSGTTETVTANSSWLISQPIVMEADTTYEILYFRHRFGAATETVNVRMSPELNMETLATSVPLHTDAVTQNSYNTTSSAVRVDFTPETSGLYYLSFQYTGPTTAHSNNNGVTLDDIAVRKKSAAGNINLSVVGLTVPDPDCMVGASGYRQSTLIVKNRSNVTVTSSQYSAHFVALNNATGSTINTADRPTGDIGPYETLTIVSGTSFIPNPGTAYLSYNIRGWISSAIDTDRSDDTLSTQTRRVRPIVPEYRMGFEPDEDLALWTINRPAASTPSALWQFVENPLQARTGEGLAQLRPGSSNSQYFYSPCLNLSTDTTYFISLSYKLSPNPHPDFNTGRPDLNLYVHTASTVESSLRRANQVEADNVSYGQLVAYFRPASSPAEGHRVTIQGVLPSRSSGLYIDDFIILDSASSTMSNLSINRLWMASSNTCDLSSLDTIYAEVQNHGLRVQHDVPFEIKFGNKTLNETWTGSIPVGSSVVIKLTTLFEHTGWGVDSVLVSINLPNRSEQGSLQAKSSKHPPVTTPYTVRFSGDETLPWNNLETSFEYDGKPFEYWTFGGSGSDTYARFENATNRLLPGVLASGCIALEPNEPYLITYRYRAESSIYTEDLKLTWHKADGTITTLAGHQFNTMTYQTNAVPFVATQATSGFERFMFYAPHNYDARGIYIDYVSIVPDTAAWPGAVELLSILSPVSDTALSSAEVVTVRIANTGRRPLKNLPVTCWVGMVRFLDTIPSLDAGQTLDYTFNTTFDLSAHGDYDITIYTTDATITNDTISKTVHCYAPNSILHLYGSSLLTIYPNPATTAVFIQSEKEIPTLQIHDLNGRLVREIRVNAKEYQLNTGDFSAGVYVFSVQMGSERVSRRVIINNQP